MKMMALFYFYTFVQIHENKHNLLWLDQLFEFLHSWNERSEYVVSCRSSLDMIPTTSSIQRIVNWIDEPQRRYQWYFLEERFSEDSWTCPLSIDQTCCWHLTEEQFHFIENVLNLVFRRLSELRLGDFVCCISGSHFHAQSWHQSRAETGQSKKYYTSYQF